MTPEESMAMEEVEGERGKEKEKNDHRKQETEINIEKSGDNQTNEKVLKDEEFSKELSEEPTDALDSSNSTTMTILIGNQRHSNNNNNSNNNNSESRVSSHSSTCESHDMNNGDLSLEDLIESLLQFSGPEHQPCGTPSFKDTERKVKSGSSCGSNSNDLSVGSRKHKHKSRSSKSSTNSLKESYLPQNLQSKTHHLPHTNNYITNPNGYLPNTNYYLPHTTPYLCNKSGRPQKVNVALSSSGCLDDKEDIDSYMSSLSTKKRESSPTVSKSSIDIAHAQGSNSFNLERNSKQCLGVT